MKSTPVRMQIKRLPQDENLQKLLTGLAITPGFDVLLERKMPFGGSYILKTLNGRFAMRKQAFESLEWFEIS